MDLFILSSKSTNPSFSITDLLRQEGSCCVVDHASLQEAGKPKSKRQVTDIHVPPGDGTDRVSIQIPVPLLGPPASRFTPTGKDSFKNVLAPERIRRKRSQFPHSEPDALPPGYRAIAKIHDLGHGQPSRYPQIGKYIPFTGRGIDGSIKIREFWKKKDLRPGETEKDRRPAEHRYMVENWQNNGFGRNNLRQSVLIASFQFSADDTRLWVC